MPERPDEPNDGARAGTATVPAMFLEAARRYPARGFLRWMQNGRTWRWTYAEAAARVAELCAQLRATGVARGDRVVIYTSETVPSLVFDLACAHLGAVFAPFDTRSTPALLDLCQRAEAAAVLTTLDRAAEVRDEGLNVLALGRDGQPDDDGPVCPALSGDAALAELARLSAPLDGDTIYMLQPTSGTTGGSKLVMRPHKVFTRVARLLGADLGLAVEPAQRVLLIQAMTHGFGQYLLATGLSLAGEFCVTSQIDTAASLDEIRELDPTYVGFTPRVIRTLVQQNGGLASGRRLLGASTRTLLTGGAKADDDLLRVIHDQGVHVIEAYGASEFSLVSVTRPGQYEPGWVGPVLPDVELRPSAEGELLARTPAMMPGYFGAPELTRAAFTEDGFYRTGDRVEIDERGMLRYLARERDMFNLFDGSNISPTPGEERMAALPWVDQVVLLGDQRPFVVALVVPHARLRGARAGMPGALRRQVELDVGRLNGALESSARIRRVALLDAPIAAEHYQIVAHGKMRRVRPAIAEAHADAVAALYAEPADPGAILDTVIEIPGSDGDRRRNTRQSAAILLLFQAGEELWLGTTLDISRSGLLAESQFAPPIGRRLTVELIEPGDGGPRRLRAEVIRHQPGRGFAVQFVDREQSRQLLGHRLPP